MQVICPHCRETFSEADEGWDRAFATGACPTCGKMIDTTREQQASLEALKPQVVRYSRQVRFTSLTLAAGSLIASAVLFVLGLRFWLVLLLFSGAQFGLAIFFTPTTAARRRLKRETDLSRFATERHEPPR